MKYRTSAEFEAQYRALSVRKQELFRQAVAAINDAYGQRGERPLPVWPARLRIKPVVDTSGIWEMTWSFSGPDGRATFEYFPAGIETAIFWRRIGTHRIFRNP